MKSVISIQDPTCLQEDLGGKARALARLAFEGFPVPAAFVVLPQTLVHSLGDNARERLSTISTPIEAAALLDKICLQEGVLTQIRTVVAEYSHVERWAVRSSASDEDGVEHSFAGQLESYLNISPEDIVDAIRSVWRSGFSERIFAYRKEAGLILPPPPPSVLIQEMVDADAAGVAFSSDPLTADSNTAVVAAVTGLGEKLVSGEADSDTFRVDRDGNIVSRSLAGGSGSSAAISDRQAASIAEMSRRCAAYFGIPQDMEWALQDGELHVLQSRPITSLKGNADSGGAFNLWDNSNIAESYSGVTTPLTFSFASMVYEEVYRQFVRILKVPESKVLDNRETFSRMLGLIRGRVYYNLLSWYRVLAMLPGFSLNRGFMEQMMGVKASLPEDQLQEILNSNRTSKWKDGLGLLATLWGLARSHFGLDANIKSFYRRLDHALSDPVPPLTHLRADELAARYHQLEKDLLTRWDAPLINDFFAMIYYGLSRKLVSKWMGPDAEGLQNDLITCQGGIISAEPAQRIRHMAQWVAGFPDLLVLFESGSKIEIEQSLPSYPELGEDVSSYLDKFGDRCLEELKLESSTLYDDPMPLYRSIGHFARRLSGDTGTTAADSESAHLNSELIPRTMRRLNPLRRFVFNWVIHQARTRVRDRENLRFERTRVFGRIRRIFVEIGKRFHAAGVLEQPRDIFYLSVHEVMGFIEGKAISTELKKTIVIRKEEYGTYRNAEAPSDRFSTRGMVYVGNTFQAPTDLEVVVPTGDVLKGLACCPGRVEGPARVITNPRGAEIKTGEILVAPRTDPGWIMLFPSAAAIVVEHGSLLSHSAIVAREMGIPAVVSVRGATQRIHTGDRIRIDGSRGEVYLLRENSDL